jgi:hypothetical protein
MSPIERHVTAAVDKVQPGAAMDFATIMALITQIFTFIQQCPFGRAKQAIRSGSVEAKAAAYLAVKRAGYGGNAVDLTQALLQQGAQATDDELDETIASAVSLPGLTRSIGVLLLLTVLGGVSAWAGPFPAPPVATQSGPFPQVTAADEPRTPHPLADETPGPQPAPEERRTVSVEPYEELPSPLQQRIAEYRAAGGAIVGVRDMTIVTHMLRDHGWSAAQIAGLSDDELFYLHGMQHAGVVEPEAVDAVHSAAPVVHQEGYPVSIEGRWAYWTAYGRRWDNRGGTLPTEGQVYAGGGRRFVYRNGRMHDATGR